MAGPVYRIEANWDAEARVWVAESDDVPGLVCEAPTVEDLIEMLHRLVPELLELNGGGPEAHDAPFSLLAKRDERARRAA